ncbi:VOC family protein [Phenylobacterium immobile]|uniref:VOC family protein n=1 Tax=Phenylobacterium immobile TaxID=21 RepID=UPI000B157CF3|nr:VOC family protein [Phenylobacterium immobile]
MTETKGRFVWHELTTSDREAATAFYGDVVGWTFDHMPMGDFIYSVAKAGEPMVAGLMETPEPAKSQGVPPHWTGYVEVESVDESARQGESLGGKTLYGPQDIPNVGRFAIVADPTGAAFALFKPLPPQGPMPEAGPTDPGAIGWNELYAGDLTEAWAYYEAMFDWRKDQAIDMGDMGVYQLFAAGDRVLGGMMTKPAQMPIPSWLYYVVVPDIDAATAKITADGGQVLMGPMEVPGGGWITQGRDPQGAYFAVTGPRL